MNELEGSEENATVDDDSMMLDHVALECMHAIEAKDKDAFLDAFHVLIADILQKMQKDEGEE